MFLLVATALAGNVIGFPCQRLNWAWRNVWTTCSINSYVPANVATDAPNTAPTFFRRSNDNTAPMSASRVLDTTGIYNPAIGPNSAGTLAPTFLCTANTATGTGFTNTLRNRCRRAIDAYGSLVRMCQLPAGLAVRGSNTASPDHDPNAAHLPHSNNVMGLTHAAQFCLLPTGGGYSPASLKTPATSCPGLLGWFTVVWNACNFNKAPGLVAASGFANSANYVVPSANGFETSLTGVLNSAPVSPTNRAGYFCKSAVGSTPDGWNDASGNGVANVFRTSRCRKALDQFGRQAARCHGIGAGQNAVTGPAQAGGYSDPLRILAVGQGANAPLGFNFWAPTCNA